MISLTKNTDPRFITLTVTMKKLRCLLKPEIRLRGRCKYTREKRVTN